MYLTQRDVVGKRHTVQRRQAGAPISLEGVNVENQSRDITFKPPAIDASIGKDWTSIDLWLHP